MSKTDNFLTEYSLHAIRDYRADIRSRISVAIQMLGLMVALEGVIVGSVLTGEIDNQLVFYSIFGKGAIALSMILLSLLLYVIAWLELNLLQCQFVLLKEKATLFKRGYKNAGKDEPFIDKSLPSYVYAFAVLMLIINFFIGIVQSTPLFGGVLDDSIWITIIADAVSFVLLALIHFARKSYIKEKKVKMHNIMSSLIPSSK